MTREERNKRARLASRKKRETPEGRAILNEMAKVAMQKMRAARHAVEPTRYCSECNAPLPRNEDMEGRPKKTCSHVCCRARANRRKKENPPSAEKHAAQLVRRNARAKLHRATDPEWKEAENKGHREWAANKNATDPAWRESNLAVQRARYRADHSSRRLAAVISTMDNAREQTEQKGDV